MNTIERLLKMDAGKIKMPEKDIKMKLKKLDNEEFVFPCKAVDPEIVAELQESALEFSDGNIDKIKMYHTKVMTIVEGCPSVFKSQELMKHFNAATPKELVKKLLVSGEMDELNNKINELGGYDKKKDKEIKN